MLSSNRIIPEFMSNNPDDTFRIIMPLNLKLDFENFGNSHFNVLIRDESTKEDFVYEMSPELLFTYFSVGNYYSNGLNTGQIDNSINKAIFPIVTNIPNSFTDIKLSKILSEKNIVSLLGWKRPFLSNAKNLYCYLIKYNNLNIIIPHFAIASYYFYRFTDMREAVLKCKLDDLHLGCDLVDSNATIILDRPRNNIDAAFIHRYACQNDATKAFDDIGVYINTYLKYMEDKYPDVNAETIPIKAKIPFKGKFTIKARFSKIVNEDTNETFHFIHEILGDTADIGFEKFSKKVHRKTTSTKVESLEELQKIQKETPDKTTEILTVKNATKKYTSQNKVKKKDNTISSLDNIEVESEDISTEDTIKLLKIYENIIIEEPVNQSLTESSTTGDKKTRKTIVSSRFDEEDKFEKKEKKYIQNFIRFNEYIKFMKTQKEIFKNMTSFGEHKLPHTLLKGLEDKVNPKCKVHGEARKYIITTFEYEELYVGLLELENADKSSTATWVIISSSSVDQSVFNDFIDEYLNENKAINDIKREYKNDDPKFTTKNHEKVDVLTDKELIKWSSGLLGKIKL